MTLILKALDETVQLSPAEFQRILTRQIAGLRRSLNYQVSTPRLDKQGSIRIARLTKEIECLVLMQG